MFDLVIAVASAFGAGNVTGYVATHLLARRAEAERRRVATDRATYGQRSTRLITMSLAAFIRSNRCRSHDKEDLGELIQNLGAGEHREDFLDPRVRRAWIQFLDQSAECGWKRLAGRITEAEIDVYTKAREAWQNAARRSFGPLPEIPTAPDMRQSSTAAEMSRTA